MHIRRLNFLLIGAFVLAAGIWLGKFVVSAYVFEPAAVQIQLTGVDLSAELSESNEESPFALEEPTDLRRFATDLAYVDEPFTGEDNEDEEPELLGGNATIVGTAIGPDGPLAGAIVRIERETDLGPATIDLRTNSEGWFAKTKLLGGRYRVRAFVPNELASANVETFFLEDVDEAEKEIDLASYEKPEPVEVSLVARPHTSKTRIELSSPGNVFVGSQGLFAVSVTRSLIDDQGVIVIRPEAGYRLKLNHPENYPVSSVSDTLTDENGVVTYNLSCGSATVGDTKAKVEAARRAIPGNQKTQLKTITQTLELPRCVPVPVVVPELPEDEDA